MSRALHAPLYAEAGAVRPPMPHRAEMLKPVTRWTPGRKACFVEAIEIGHLSEAEVMAAHNVSADEIAIWRENMRRGGIRHLRLKTIQKQVFRLPLSTVCPLGAARLLPGPLRPLPRVRRAIAYRSA